MNKVYFSSLVLILTFSSWSCQNLADGIDPIQTEDFEPIIVLDTIFDFQVRHLVEPVSQNAFDWETGFHHEATYFSQNNSGFSTGLISYPWKTQGNSLNRVDSDFTQKAGWRLISSDWGTPESPVERPYFSIYNSAIGKLFVFVDNTKNQAGTYIVGSLAIWDETTGQPITFESKKASFNMFESWFNFEYDIPEQHRQEILNKNRWIISAVGVQEYFIQPTK